MTENNALLIKGKLTCVALNDRDHVAAMQERFNADPHKKPPTQPTLYYKPRNTWNVHGATVPWPEGHDEFVVGASLGVVIGPQACRVSPEEALNYVQGYCIVHDFSLPEKSYYRPDIKGKCRDLTAPVGPRIVPAGEVADPNNLRVVTSVNGEVKSTTSTANLERSIAELISTISYVMTLAPGEIIAVGFSGNRVAVKPGDKVATVIDGVGELTNTVGGA